MEKCSSTGGEERWLENEEWNTCVDRHRKPLSVGYLSPLMSVGQPASAKKIKENCSCRSTQQGTKLFRSGPIVPSPGLQKVKDPWNRVLTLASTLIDSLRANEGSNVGKGAIDGSQIKEPILVSRVFTGSLNTKSHHFRPYRIWLCIITGCKPDFFFFYLFSCPGQLNRWPCQSFSESGHFWF